MTDDRHRAPYYSAERTAYFEDKMQDYAERGSRYLVFTPPTDRGSLVTHCEAWALNLQRDFVPTLTDMGRWPVVTVGTHPSDLSREQREWLFAHWGDCACKWVGAGCPQLATVASLSEARVAHKKAAYADLVMKTFADFEHEDKREVLQRKAEVERLARQRL